MIERCVMTDDQTKLFKSIMMIDIVIIIDIMITNFIDPT